MATEPYLGEIRIFGFTYPPKGWALCNGQLMAINQNQALFSILGTTYGGDGRTTFGLPNLQGKVAVHPGQGFALGQVGGSAAVTLLSSQIGHSHQVSASASANSFAAAGNFPAPAPTGQSLYGSGPNAQMNQAVISPAGGFQPHNNMQPFLTVIYCIAVQGVFPSRS